jgi:hypothetical protein
MTQNRPLHAARLAVFKISNYSNIYITRPTPQHQGHMKLKPFGPAMHHILALSLMSCMILGAHGDAPSKTHALRSFHKHHTTRMTSELKPKRYCLGTSNSAARHHSWKFPSLACSVHCREPTKNNTWNQISLEKAHVTRMCCIDVLKILASWFRMFSRP